MDSFSAVTTTGIYCRPGCAARPSPRNVERFASAAAAEAAGYRACLRCRPYRGRPLLASAGPELVCRAVQLVLDGALDGQTEQALGARVGVSPRHLRRLFKHHLGASPDQLARSRRAHFARRLLDDTDLSVTAVAFASGFGSVRQLNRACREIFRAPPGELRARRRRHDRLVADGGLVLRLDHEQPLDWETMVAYFAARAIPGVEHVAGGIYTRTVAIDGDPGVIEVSRGSAEQLLLRAHLPHWEGLIHHVDGARRVFNLDAEPAVAGACLAADPLFAASLRARPGLRPPGAWDPFELGVRAIVGQQVSVAAANTLMGRLVARHGTPVPGLAQLGLTHLFPQARRLASGSLDGIGLTGARIGALRAFARAVADGRLELDRARPLDQLVASITAIEGLGEWTAHYIALRLGEPDAFPASDLGLRRALAAGDEGRRAVSRGDCEARAEPWRPYRAYAATHLWLASVRAGADDPR